ncbi:MAG TPA: clostripain-related cysteine peptidase, partial [Candidatus Babeliales bacterium]|nr:clostripain-related cysteine peptidase [Candidatus Babeliales bacterium]
MLKLITKTSNTKIHKLILILLCFTLNTLHAKANDISSNSQTKIAYEQCYCDFCKEIHQTSSVKTYKKHITKKSKKEPKNKTFPAKRLLMIYMAADNDLRPFAARNIQQMANIGSNQNITIVVHLDIRISGNKKITRRYLIERDQVLHIDPYNPLTQQMDSGNPATLISFCEWAIKNYAAEEYDLVLWNHGTGILEPPHGKIINPMDLFVFNPATHLFDLDR